MAGQLTSQAMHYRDRAEGFRETIGWLQDLLDPRKEWPRHLNSAALLAVHAGIALNDAVLCFCNGQPCKGQSHQEAVRQLVRACTRRHVDPRGAEHLWDLVRQKDHFSYGDQRVTEEQVRRALVGMERFAQWVYTAFPALARPRNSP